MHFETEKETAKSMTLFETKNGITAKRPEILNRIQRFNKDGDSFLHVSDLRRFLELYKKPNEKLYIFKD